jgi:hypothetical protein
MLKEINRESASVSLDSRSTLDHLSRAVLRKDALIQMPKETTPLNVFVRLVI